MNLINIDLTIFSIDLLYSEYNEYSEYKQIIFK